MFIILILIWVSWFVTDSMVPTIVLSLLGIAYMLLEPIGKQLVDEAVAKEIAKNEAKREAAKTSKEESS